jgi:hypothetical protein
MRFQHLGPLASLCTTHDPVKQLTLQRPLYFSEDIYNMMYERASILFPQSSPAELEKYMAKKYDMPKNPEPIEKPVVGSKTFWFKSIHLEGDINLQPDTGYDDYVWVPKKEMNKYLDRETYNTFIKCLTNL